MKPKEGNTHGREFTPYLFLSIRPIKQKLKQQFYKSLNIFKNLQINIPFMKALEKNVIIHETYEEDSKKEEEIQRLWDHYP